MDLKFIQQRIFISFLSMRADRMEFMENRIQPIQTSEERMASVIVMLFFSSLRHSPSLYHFFCFFPHSYPSVRFAYNYKICHID